MAADSARVGSLWLIVVLISILVQTNGVIAGDGEGGGSGQDDPVYFADPRLEAWVEAHLGVMDPVPADMLRLTQLVVVSQGVSDLTGLEYAQNLQRLYLTGNPIHDIFPLSGLTRLLVLELSYTQVSDISALRSLRGLLALTITFAQVSDISALAELTNLRELYLFQNKIGDISPLAGLRNLAVLLLDHNQISDISPLASLTRLTELTLGINQISNVSALSQLANLTTLDLPKNNISDVSSLGGLTGLRNLNLLGNKIGDISPLASLQSLRGLNLLDNEISDVSSLAHLTNLVELSLAGNRISDVSVLARLANLTKLHLGMNQIADISSLSQLTNLQELYLMENQISDISPLAQLTNLSVLNLYKNQIFDISYLANLPNLTVLHLAGNEVSDVSCLAQMSGWSVLGLSDNPLSCSAYRTDIPQLLERNPYVNILYDPAPATCDWEPQGRILFVDSRAAGGGDGTAWDRAFKYLQDAMKAAVYGDEIRVAQGVYVPDRGTSVRSGDRHATFRLKNGLTLKGGYAGMGPVGRRGAPVDPNMRDISRYETVLSGDLAGDDRGDYSDLSRFENSLHVVFGRHVGGTTVLDGFTIAGGHASDTSQTERTDGLCGGGMLIGDPMGDTNLSLIAVGAPVIRSCTFKDNYAFLWGGGLYCDVASLVDCRFVHNHAQLQGGGMFTPALNTTADGCLFSGNSAGKEGGGIYAWYVDMSLIGCTFEDNRAAVADAVWILGLAPGGTGPLTVSDVVIGENVATSPESDRFWLRDSHIRLEGELGIVAGRLNIGSSRLDGTGKIHLGEQATLRIAGAPGSEPTIIQADIEGTGDIEIDAGQQLIVGGDSVVNLSGLTDHIPNVDQGGRIIVKGALVVQDRATVENTHVSVKLFDVNTPNHIQHNDITLLEASTGFGGEFFVGGQAQIRYNNILSEGDRYLDLDPDARADERPVINNNHVTVIIKEGALGSQGTLLELRAKDYDTGTTANPLGGSGAYQVPAPSPGFTEDPSENWVLEKLILDPDSKVNLTNRQGFEFQDLGDCCPGSWETVYVKELVMGPDSVLNTGLQTLYYQHLTDPNGNELVRDEVDPFAPLANGARFQDIPVLGFSLGIIAMDDPTPAPHNEFDIRVRRRLIDPEDNQPNPSYPTRSGLITRTDAHPGIPIGCGGIMDMRTQAPGRDSASSVAAKGAFARAGDEDITIEFEYLFMEDGEGQAELVVSVSDDPEVGRDLVPVARIRPPQFGRPGSIGARRFAIFSGTFPRGDLNFKRGTYVELELRGIGTRCWIDNWDPKVNCIGICGDYDNTDLMNVTNIYDYFVLLAEYGLDLSGAAGAGKRCLDLVRDGCVNADDMRVWNINEVLNRCPRETTLTATASPTQAIRAAAHPPAASIRSTSTSAPLVIAGKPGKGVGTYIPESMLFLAQTGGGVIETESLQSSVLGKPSDGRLVTDPAGDVYQLNSEIGLIRQDTGVVVARPMVVPRGDSTILIGFHDYTGDWENEGYVLLDCVFHPQDSSIVYVVPVWVDDGGYPYQAAAKLQLIGDGEYDIVGLYGCDPSSDPDQSIALLDSPGEVVFEPDAQHVCEIEIDRQGNHLFVLNRHLTNNSNSIMVYDESSGGRPIAVWDVNVPAPTAMLASAVEDRLYLASSLSGPNDLAPEVYQYMVNVAEPESSLIYGGSVSIRCPSPLQDMGQGYRATVTSLVEDASSGTVYAVGFVMPCVPADETMNRIVRKYLHGSPEFFTTPFLATFTPDDEWTQARTVSGGNPSLALPLSAAWVGARE